MDRLSGLYIHSDPRGPMKLCLWNHKRELTLPGHKSAVSLLKRSSVIISRTVMTTGRQTIQPSFCDGMSSSCISIRACMLRSTKTLASSATIICSTFFFDIHKQRSNAGNQPPLFLFNNFVGIFDFDGNHPDIPYCFILIACHVYQILNRNFIFAHH